MSFPVLVESNEDQFAASLLGAPDVRVVEPTRSQAIAALKAKIQERIDHGELLSLDLEQAGVSDLAGRYRDDPTLSDICDHAYRLRDGKSTA